MLDTSFWTVAFKVGNLGLTPITVPDLIVILRAQQLIPDHVARAMLVTSERHGTSPALIAVAHQVLDLVGDVQQAN